MTGEVGMTGISRQIGAKRFELLMEMRRGRARGAAIWNRTNRRNRSSFPTFRATAVPTDIDIQSVEVGSIKDFALAFDAVTRLSSMRHAHPSSDPAPCRCRSNPRAQTRVLKSGGANPTLDPTTVRKNGVSGSGLAPDRPTRIR